MTNFSLSYNGKHQINLLKNIMWQILQRQTIRSLSVFAVFVLYFSLSGCTHKSAQNSNLQVFENQNADNQQIHYTQAYIVRPDQDPYSMSAQLAAALEATGIQTSEYKSRDFFAPQGTGFFITESGYMLTCDHVIGYRDTLTFKNKNTLFTARVLFRDPVTDLALLKTDTNGPFTALQFSSSHHTLGEEVFALGYPLSGLLGIEPRLTQGIISAKVGFGDEPTRFQISTPIQPGNSGGPVLNQFGEVVGIAQSTLNSEKAKAYTGGVTPQNVNFAITPNTISAFLGTAVELGLFPQQQWQSIFLKPSSPIISSSIQANSVTTQQSAKPVFGPAEAATVLISGAPQNKDEAMVIALDYLPATLQQQIELDKPLIPEFILVEGTKVLELPSLALKNLLQTLSGQGSKQAIEPSTAQPVIEKLKQPTHNTIPALSSFSLTLYDFRSKKPLFKMIQRSEITQTSILIRESLQQMKSFLPLMDYPSQMEHVKVDQNTIQAVAVEPALPLTKHPQPANQQQPQH